MKRTWIATLIVLLAVSLTGLAKEKTSRHWLTLYDKGTVNGADLPPGEYKVEYSANEAVFFKGRKEVARTPMLLEKVEPKFDRNSVVYVGGSITELRIAGKDSKLVLGPGTVANRATEKPAKANE